MKIRQSDKHTSSPGSENAAMETMYISAILKKENQVHYTRDVYDKKISECDFIILPTSIIAHETELEAIKLHKNKKIFVIGIFSNTFRDKYKNDNTLIVKNESDIFFF